MSVHDLTRQERREFRETFDAIDKDKSGNIDCNELKAALKSLGYWLTTKEVRDFIATSDTDGDGKLDFEEFLQMMARQKKEKKIRDAFHMFDRDRNGTIDVYELKDTMQMLGANLTNEEVLKLMLKVDSDGDMKIDYEEFKVLWTQYRR